MRLSTRLSLLALALPLAGQACRPEAEEAAMSGDPAIEARMKKYAVTTMETRLSEYSDRERAMLRELLRAAELADEIYWRQTSHLAVAMRREIFASYAEDDPVRQFFVMQGGPYDRLDHDAPFIEGVPPKAPGAGFYPEDLTAEEFHAWIDQHPEDRDAFMSPYTVIRRDGEQLVAVPYHEEYSEFTLPLARALYAAAELSDDRGFARYLQVKADGILSDQYFFADSVWIKLEGNKFDLTIGPFEFYEDGLLNIKAAYEASVEIVDQEESAKLEIYKQHLADLEANLPYDDRYKPASAGLTSTFTIVRDIYRGGHLRVGYQPVAANLPNDPRVQVEVGNKKTFWKNFFDARVNQVILPISKQLIVESQVENVTPQGFFDAVLLHEIAHGLGPRYAETPAGRVPVNQALTTHYTWIEEAKATIAGLESLAYLVEAGVIDPELQPQYYTSYLGSIFRTIRFGTGEAHGVAALVELNYFLEKGGISYDATSGRYAVDYEVLPARISDLARDLLTIEATGDAAAAQELRDKYGTEGPELREALRRVADVPIDPSPFYRNVW